MCTNFDMERGVKGERVRLFKEICSELVNVYGITEAVRIKSD